MKHIQPLLFGLALLLLAANACVPANSTATDNSADGFMSLFDSDDDSYKGTSNSTVRNVENFSQVSVAEAIKAQLKQGNKTEVRLEVENIDIDRVITEVRGNELHLHIKGNRPRRAVVEAYITYKSLEAISGSSAARVKLLDDVKTDDFELAASSAAEIQTNGKIEAANVKVDVSSGAAINVTELIGSQMSFDASSGGGVSVEAGTVDRLRVGASSGGKLNAYDLVAQSVRASVSSGGGAQVQAVKSMVGRASSGGWISYIGNPEKVDSDKSSGGTIRKKSM